MAESNDVDVRELLGEESTSGGYDPVSGGGPKLNILFYTIGLMLLWFIFLFIVTYVVSWAKKSSHSKVRHNPSCRVSQSPYSTPYRQVRSDVY